MCAAATMRSRTRTAASNSSSVGYSKRRGDPSKAATISRRSENSPWRSSRSASPSVSKRGVSPTAACAVSVASSVSPRRSICVYSASPSASRQASKRSRADGATRCSRIPAICSRWPKPMRPRNSLCIFFLHPPPMPCVFRIGSVYGGRITPRAEGGASDSLHFVTRFSSGETRGGASGASKPDALVLAPGRRGACLAQFIVSYSGSVRNSGYSGARLMRSKRRAACS